MADEKSIVKMNKMIHKKTGASFFVYVIYVSLVYTDSKKTASCLLPRHTIFATFGKQIKMPTCILASVSFWPLLIIESVARVSQHVLFAHELLVKQV